MFKYEIKNILINVGSGNNIQILKLGTLVERYTRKIPVKNLYKKFGKRALPRTLFLNILLHNGNPNIA